MEMDVVHTYLYTDEAFKDFEAIRAEALRVAYGVTYSQVRGFDVSRAPDGEVIFVQNDDTTYCTRYVHNCAWRRGNAGFCKWLGCMIKRFTVNYFKLNAWDSFSPKKLEVKWDTEDERTGRYTKHKHSISVATLHLYYDLLLNHKLKDSIYSKAVIDAHVGKPLDPITTEIMTAKRDEIKALTEAYNAAVKKLDDDCDDECDLLEQEFDSKCDALRDKADKAKEELTRKHEADLKAVEARYASIPAAA